MKNLEISKYEINLGFKEGFLAVVASDLHNAKDYLEIIDEIDKIAPEVVFIPGDLCDGIRNFSCGVEFLNIISNKYKTFYSIGNHEKYHGGINEYLKIAKLTKATILDDSYVEYKDFLIGGLTTGFGTHQGTFSKTPLPNYDFAKEFSSIDKRKILLCHHPEYFDTLKNMNIDLILSGHAHGGQWIIGNKGVFAPGQGLFPKYTSGLYENKMVLSRGLKESGLIPRINNKRHLIVLDIK